MKNINDGLYSGANGCIEGRSPADGQKVAVVTGGANGIGKCITEEFRKQGVKVYVIDKSAADRELYSG